MITAKVESISPARAKQYMEVNTNNFRQLDRQRVSRYAKDMLSHEWLVTGEPIIFNGDGSLMNGQHRLQACIEAGVAFDTLVVRGISSNSAVNMDRGKPRTVAQWLRHKGLKSYNAMAAMARLCVIYEHGLWHLRAVGAGYYTDTEVVNYAVTHHENMLSAFHLSAKQQLTSRPLVATVLFFGANQSAAEENPVCSWFAQGLATGSDLNEDDACFHLRNRLIAQQSTHSKMDRFTLKMLISKAWNYTAESTACSSKSLLVRTVGPSKTKPIRKIIPAI
jgi:hypothetical protein